MNELHATKLDEVLMARAVLYGLLQRVFADVPDDVLAENESCEVMDQCFAVLGDAWGLEDGRTIRADGAFGNGADSSVPDAPDAAVDSTSGTTDIAVDSTSGTTSVSAAPALTLEGEYNRLFVGVGKPAVCLWESIYETGVNALFQQNTLAVRAFYADWGFEARDKGRVADDHVAIELAFLRELTLQAANGQGAERERLLEAQRCFLSDHLLRWSDAFAQQVIDNDHTGYYAAYARLLADFVRRDETFLNEVLSGPVK